VWKMRPVCPVNISRSDRAATALGCPHAWQ